MTTLDDFITLIRDELGIPVTIEDVDRQFGELPGWDSVNLLQLLSALERETGQQLSLPEMLDAPSLGRIFELAVAS